MAATETASRLAPYLEQLLEDDKARQNLRRGADKLRDAYDRSQKRRVKAARDQKLRGQVRSAATSLGAGATALAKGAQKPKKRRGGLALKGLALAAVAGGVAIALNEELRSSVLGSRSPGAEGSGAPSPDGVDGSPS
jgi:hypothetical protein